MDWILGKPAFQPGPAVEY